MAYLAKADLKGIIPDEWLEGAMDDNVDGSADANVWDQVEATVSEEINGRLSGHYATPISPVPDVIKSAAKALACWLLYKRYGAMDARNPWADLAKDWRARLDRIGRGEEQLSRGQPATSPAGVVISQPAKTHSAAGGLMI